MKQEPTNLEIIEKEMQEELKPIIAEFYKKKKEINGEIVTNNFELQEKIEEMKNSTISFTINSNDGSRSTRTISPEMQKIFMETMIEREKAEKENSEEELNKQREEIEKETNKKCKDVVEKFKGKLEEKIDAEKEKLENILNDMKRSNAEMKDIKNAISGLGPRPESRIFTLLNAERGTIIRKKQEMNKEKNAISKNIEVAQLELDDFNAKYGNLNFENEALITDLLSILYGENADYEALIEGEEWDWYNEIDKEKETQKQSLLAEKRSQAEEMRRKKGRQNPSKEGEQEAGQNPPKATEQGEGQKQPKEGEQGKGQQSPKTAKQEEGQKQPKEEEQGKGQQPQKVAEQKNTKPTEQTSSKEQEPKGEGLSQNEKSAPRMKYIAVKDTYVIEGKPNRYLAVKRNISNIDKLEIARIMQVSKEQLDYADIGALVAWLEYDGKYKTNEAFNYLRSISNPEISGEKVQNIEYDLIKINKNKNLSKADRRNMLECINYAQEFKIANVKKGLGMKVREKFSSIINRFNRNRIGGKKKSGAEILPKSMKNKKRKNKFKQEIAVTSAYDKISKEISGADIGQINNILDKAKEALREGKISKTEYSGLVYNANNKLSNTNPSTKQPTPVKASNEQGDR